MLKKVFVAFHIPEDVVSRLKQYYEVVDFYHEFSIIPENIMKERMKDADVIAVIPLIPITAEMMDCNPNLKFIVSAGAGYDKIDVKAATERNILVTNTPGPVAPSVAELAIGLLLAGSRQIVRAANYCSANQFVHFRPMSFPGLTVTGSTVAIVGPGLIGTLIAKRISGFEPKLVYVGNRENETINELGGRRVTMDEMLEIADFIFIATPLNESTRGMFNTQLFNRMKPTVGIINVGRGPIVVTDDVVDALKTNRIAFYATDVTDPEPLPKDHELLKLKNAIVTPHMGASTQAVIDGLNEGAIQSVIEYGEKRKPSRVVNPAVYDQLK